MIFCNVANTGMILMVFKYIKKFVWGKIDSGGSEKLRSVENCISKIWPD